MVPASALRDEVEAAALEAGLDAVGVTTAAPFDAVRRQLVRQRDDGLHGGMEFTYRNPARSTDPSRALPGAASLIVGARRYLRRPPRAVETAEPTARIARYAWTDPYEPLRAGLSAVAAVLTGAGFRACVVADDNALVDRAAAVRAGIGWYGKNANVLIPGHGSWFVLGSVITDAAFGQTAEPVADGCGACARCLRGCPTGAIVAPGVVDARRCLAWLVQAPGDFPRPYREALGDRIYGCDDCQEVCPLNRVEEPPPEAEPGARDRLPVLELLALDDEALLAEVGHWYIPKREPRYVRRNALIVLGNTGDSQDPAVRSALRTALASDDPLIRGHAVWAAARLGLPEMADALAVTEADAVVRAELDARADMARSR